MKMCWLVAGFALAAVCSSCRRDNTPVGPDGVAFGEYALEYTVAGGFSGGTHTRMSIHSEGSVVLRTIDPPIQGTLTSMEQSALSQLAQSIWDQPDTLNGGCVDDFNFLVQWSDTRGVKKINTDGCALMGSRGAQYPVLTGLIHLLDSIARRVYQNDAPWRGMTASFAVDDSSYSLDEPILLSYVLKNPTAQTRTLNFPHANKVWFSVSEDNVPAFYYAYPYAYPTSLSSSWNAHDSSLPSSIVLGPGEEKTLTYTWDQSIVNVSGTPGKLGVGTYHVQMGLLAGDFTVQNSVFDVYDKSIPIKGKVIPDYADADISSASYTFELQITNWTNATQTLHFLNAQRIALEVWDLNFDPPTTIIYTTALLPSDSPETLSLAPHESVRFSETVNKSSMKPWYMWVLAKISLRCTDFSFTQEAQLQISRTSTRTHSAGSSIQETARLP